jgi:HK97 family phage prohead protease/HK97 family phage major capsid protein
MTDINVTFSADITAADEGRRTITGQIVPFGAWGETSMGPVQFAKGAFSDVPKVKLLLEHDPKRPIGRLQQSMPTPEGINATFKVSRTGAGTDALVEAADGLRDGLSVGARIIDFEQTDEGMVVTAAELSEVSLVHTPAFSEAVVSQVAASASAAPEPDSPEEPNMENETPEVETAEVVEASEPVVEAAAPTRQYVTVGAPRALDNMTPGRFAKTQLEAAAGDRDAQMIVEAALADNTTTTGAGVVPTRFLTEVISVLDNSRPFVDAISRDNLPDAGMDFKIPRVTQKPSVAEQAAEGDEVSSTAFTLDYLTVDVKTFGGGQRISRQLIERSDPAFLDRLIIEMTAQYAQATDLYAFGVATAGAGTSDGADIYQSIVKGIADSSSVMRFTPSHLVVPASGSGSITLEKLLQQVDGSDRPLFAAAQPQNAAGNITQGSTNGTVAGLQLVVDHNLGTGNTAARVFPSAAVTFYESAGAPVQVSVQDASTLEVEVSVYGYVAAAAKYPTAVRTLTVTP